jgi:ribosomal protein S18 acetylase RimI-like enzyme
MFEIKNASDCSMVQLRNAMQIAFSDYAIPLQLNEDSFALMMRQRGLDKPCSRIALVEDEVVAIWLVSSRDSKAYLISSGTIPNFRKRGISRALAADCIAGLRDKAVKSFQTEVLRDNEKAAALYYSLGMEKQRLLDCYVVPAQTPSIGTMPQFSKVAWLDIEPSVRGVRDWMPSWQNIDTSLAAIADHVTCFALTDGIGLSAYAAFSAQSGTVYQLAVRQDMRCNGLGTALIRAVQCELPQTPLRFINVQNDDQAFTSLMAHVDAQETIGQFELAMQL